MKYYIHYRDYNTDIEGCTAPIVEQCMFAHPIHRVYQIIAEYKEVDRKHGTNCDYWLVPA
jgi:hypothetical protein